MYMYMYMYMYMHGHVCALFACMALVGVAGHWNDFSLNSGRIIEGICIHVYVGIRVLFNFAEH